MRNAFKCFICIFTVLFTVNVNAIADTDCNGNGMQLTWMTTGVKSLKMQGVKLTPFLQGIDKLYTQPGGDGGKLTNNYDCTLIGKDPTPSEAGILIFLFTPKKSVSVNERSNLPDTIYFRGELPLGAKQPSCYVVRFEENGVESKKVGFAKFNSAIGIPDAVMSCK